MVGAGQWRKTVSPSPSLSLYPHHHSHHHCLTSASCLCPFCPMDGHVQCYLSAACARSALRTRFACRRSFLLHLHSLHTLLRAAWVAFWICRVLLPAPLRTATTAFSFGVCAPHLYHLLYTCCCCLLFRFLRSFSAAARCCASARAFSPSARISTRTHNIYVAALLPALFSACCAAALPHARTISCCAPFRFGWVLSCWIGFPAVIRARISPRVSPHAPFLLRATTFALAFFLSFAHPIRAHARLRARSRFFLHCLPLTPRSSATHTSLPHTCILS